MKICKTFSAPTKATSGRPAYAQALLVIKMHTRPRAQLLLFWFFASSNVRCRHSFSDFIIQYYTSAIKRDCLPSPTSRAFSQEVLIINVINFHNPSLILSSLGTREYRRAYITATSIVNSKIDCCNSLFYDTNFYQTKRLQTIQNDL